MRVHYALSFIWLMPGKPLIPSSIASIVGSFKVMVTYDVIIAGGGPAGSLAALILARAGKKVLVLEKVPFPRPKVCGYSVNPRSWAVWQRHGLAERFARLPHYAISGFTLEHQGVPVLQHRFRGPGARTVDRGPLDAWLADEAQASGATYRFGVAVQGLTSTGVQTSEGEFHAPVIIGADGRNSAVGRLSNLARPSNPCGRIGWQTYLDLPSLDDHVHMNVFPEGYYGLNRIDASRTTMTVVLFSARKTTPEQILARYLPGGSSDSWKSIHPISRGPWEVTDGRCWLIGDAACVLEPLTGEGIYSALATAEMAARQILAIERTSLAAAVRGYRRQHRRFYGWRSMINACVRWSLEDSSRSMRVMNGLKWWPAAAAQAVEWVQGPANPRLQTG
jgi:flavin-dependent dehydrogenase